MLVGGLQQVCMFCGHLIGRAASICRYWCISEDLSDGYLPTPATLILREELYLQGVSENTDTFILSIVFMLLSLVICDKHLKIASSMEIC